MSAYLHIRGEQSITEALATMYSVITHNKREPITSSTSSSSTSLLDMPRELRDMIYGHVFTSNTWLRPIASKTPRQKAREAFSRNRRHRSETMLDCGLLCTNKQIYAEANQALIESNKIYIEDIPGRQNKAVAQRLVQILQIAKVLRYKVNLLNPDIHRLKVVAAKKNLKVLEVVLENEWFLWEWQRDEEKAKKKLALLREIKPRNSAAVMLPCAFGFVGDDSGELVLQLRAFIRRDVISRMIRGSAATAIDVNKVIMRKWKAC
jgi:hypothetical protein